MSRPITLLKPDDWHCHLRDGEFLSRTVADQSKQFSRSLVMPNLADPITTTQKALAYKKRILAHLPDNNHDFKPMMTLYLTDQTTPEIINEAAQCPDIIAVKLYPQGATTKSEFGVSDLDKLYPVFAAMQSMQMPLCIHGEVVGPEIDVFDREAVFIEKTLKPLASAFPQLKIILEHISTQEGIEFVINASDNIAGTVTPQHLLLNRNALFAGGLRPHHYCLPILKAKQHQLAIINAVMSGTQKLFAGTDSAPHPQGQKESACGCAGIYSAHAAMELYATSFAAHNALDKLENFSSRFGAQFYGLAINQEKIQLVPRYWQVPASYSFGNSVVVPLFAEKTLQWKYVGKTND